MALGPKSHSIRKSTAKREVKEAICVMPRTKKARPPRSGRLQQISTSPTTPPRSPDNALFVSSRDDKAVKNERSRMSSATRVKRASNEQSSDDDDEVNVGFLTLPQCFDRSNNTFSRDDGSSVERSSQEGSSIGTTDEGASSVFTTSDDGTTDGDSTVVSLVSVDEESSGITHHEINDGLKSFDSNTDFSHFGTTKNNLTQWGSCLGSSEKNLLSDDDSITEAEDRYYKLGGFMGLSSADIRCTPFPIDSYSSDCNSDKDNLSDSEEDDSSGICSTDQNNHIDLVDCNSSCYDKDEPPQIVRDSSDDATIIAYHAEGYHLQSPMSNISADLNAYEDSRSADDFDDDCTRPLLNEYRSFNSTSTSVDLQEEECLSRMFESSKDDSKVNLTPRTLLDRFETDNHWTQDEVSASNDCDERTTLLSKLCSGSHNTHLVAVTPAFSPDSTRPSNSAKSYGTVIHSASSQHKDTLLSEYRVNPLADQVEVHHHYHPDSHADGTSVVSKGSNVLTKSPFLGKTRISKKSKINNNNTDNAVMNSTSRVSSHHTDTLLSEYCVNPSADQVEVHHHNHLDGHADRTSTASKERSKVLTKLPFVGKPRISKKSKVNNNNTDNAVINSAPRVLSQHTDTLLSEYCVDSSADQVEVHHHYHLDGHADRTSTASKEGSKVLTILPFVGKTRITKKSKVNNNNTDNAVMNSTSRVLSQQTDTLLSEYCVNPSADQVEVHHHYHPDGHVDGTSAASKGSNVLTKSPFVGKTRISKKSKVNNTDNAVMNSASLVLSQHTDSLLSDYCVDSSADQVEVHQHYHPDGHVDGTSDVSEELNMSSSLPDRLATKPSIAQQPQTSQIPNTAPIDPDMNSPHIGLLNSGTEALSTEYLALNFSFSTNHIEVHELLDCAILTSASSAVTSEASKLNSFALLRSDTNRSTTSDDSSIQSHCTYNKMSPATPNLETKALLTEYRALNFSTSVDQEEVHESLDRISLAAADRWISELLDPDPPLDFHLETEEDSSTDPEADVSSFASFSAASDISGNAGWFVDVLREHSFSEFRISVSGHNEHSEGDTVDESFFDSLSTSQKSESNETDEGVSSGSDKDEGSTFTGDQELMEPNFSGVKSDVPSDGGYFEIVTMDSAFAGTIAARVLLTSTDAKLRHSFVDCIDATDNILDVAMTGDVDQTGDPNAIDKYTPEGCNVFSSDNATEVINSSVSELNPECESIVVNKETTFNGCLSPKKFLSDDESTDGVLACRSNDTAAHSCANNLHAVGNLTNFTSRTEDAVLQDRGATVLTKDSLYTYMGDVNVQEQRFFDSDNRLVTGSVEKDCSIETNADNLTPESTNDDALEEGAVLEEKGLLLDLIIKLGLHNGFKKDVCESKPEHEKNNTCAGLVTDCDETTDESSSNFKESLAVLEQTNAFANRREMESFLRHEDCFSSEDVASDGEVVAAEDPGHNCNQEYQKDETLLVDSVGRDEDLSNDQSGREAGTSAISSNCSEHDMGKQSCKVSQIISSARSTERSQCSEQGSGDVSDNNTSNVGNANLAVYMTKGLTLPIDCAVVTNTAPFETEIKPLVDDENQASVVDNQGANVFGCNNNSPAIAVDSNVIVHVAENLGSVKDHELESKNETFLAAVDIAQHSGSVDTSNLTLRRCNDAFADDFLSVSNHIDYAVKEGANVTEECKVVNTNPSDHDRCPMPISQNDNLFDNEIFKQKDTYLADASVVTDADTFRTEDYLKAHDYSKDLCSSSCENRSVHNPIFHVNQETDADAGKLISNIKLTEDNYEIDNQADEEHPSFLKVAVIDMPSTDGKNEDFSVAADNLEVDQDVVADLFVDYDDDVALRISETELLKTSLNTELSEMHQVNSSVEDRRTMNTHESTSNVSNFLEANSEISGNQLDIVTVKVNTEVQEVRKAATPVCKQLATSSSFETDPGVYKKTTSTAVLNAPISDVSVGTSEFEYDRAASCYVEVSGNNILGSQTISDTLLIESKLRAEESQRDFTNEMASSFDDMRLNIDAPPSGANLTKEGEQRDLYIGNEDDICQAIANKIAFGQEGILQLEEVECHIVNNVRNDSAAFFENQYVDSRSEKCLFAAKEHLPELPQIINPAIIDEIGEAEFATTNLSFHVQSLESQPTINTDEQTGQKLKSCLLHPLSASLASDRNQSVDSSLSNNGATGETGLTVSELCVSSDHIANNSEASQNYLQLRPIANQGEDSVMIGAQNDVLSVAIIDNNTKSGNDEYSLEICGKAKVEATSPKRLQLRPIANQGEDSVMVGPQNDFLSLAIGNNTKSVNQDALEICGKEKIEENLKSCLPAAKTKTLLEELAELKIKMGVRSSGNATTNNRCSSDNNVQAMGSTLSNFGSHVGIATESVLHLLNATKEEANRTIARAQHVQK